MYCNWNCMVTWLCLNTESEVCILHNLHNQTNTHSCSNLTVKKMAPYIQARIYSSSQNSPISLLRFDHSLYTCSVTMYIYNNPSLISVRTKRKFPVCYLQPFLIIWISFLSKQPSHNYKIKQIWNDNSNVAYNYQCLHSNCRAIFIYFNSLYYNVKLIYSASLLI